MSEGGFLTAVYVASAFGALLWLWWTAQFCRFVWLYFLRPATDLRPFGACLGSQLGQRSWAVVTGASEGVGRGFAVVLAERGFNVVVMSRRMDALKAVAAELEAKGAEVRCVEADANVDTPEQWQAIDAGLQGLDLAVLVNNVGLNTAIPAALTQCTVEEVDRMVNVNVRFGTKLTQRLLPRLQDRSHSALINISSVSKDIPGAMLAVYAGTKSYMDVFTRSLAAELEGTSVVCMSVVPGYVLSRANPIKKESFFVVGAEKFARLSLDKLGARRSLMPYLGHAVMQWPAQLLPESFIGAETLKMMRADRAARTSS